MKLRKRVYLETTIPSYLAARPSRDIVVAGHQQITLDWWESRRAGFDLFISQFVLDEISLGDRAAVGRRVGFLRGLAELRIDDAVVDLADGLVTPGAIPAGAARDAAHIAVAAVHKMDYLLTWSCAHIANAELVPAVRRICYLHGYECPTICTPEELMGA